MLSKAEHIEMEIGRMISEFRVGVWEVFRWSFPNVRYVRPKGEKAINPNEAGW